MRRGVRKLVLFAHLSCFLGVEPSWPFPALSLLKHTTLSKQFLDGDKRWPIPQGQTPHWMQSQGTHHSYLRVLKETRSPACHCSSPELPLRPHLTRIHNLDNNLP